MSQLAPEHFPDDIVDAYLDANTRYPQTITASTIAMGSVAIPSILFGGYSWNRFLTDTVSEEQLDRASAKISAAHGSAIPFRPGSSAGEENGVTIFPHARINKLIHDVAVEVSYITTDMLHHLQTDPPLSEHYAYSSPERPYVLQDRTNLRPAEIGAVATLFTAAHRSLSVSNETTLSIRRDLHHNLRDFYRNPPNYNEDVLKDMKRRVSDVVLDGIMEGLPRVDAWLGGSVPAIFSNTFLKQVVKDVAIPSRTE